MYERLEQAMPCLRSVTQQRCLCLLQSRLESLRTRADEAHPADGNAGACEAVLKRLHEPREVAVEVLMSTSRSAMVLTFFGVLRSWAPSTSVREQVCAWVSHLLLHDAAQMQQSTSIEPSAPAPQTIAACYDLEPDRSWADQAPASAGRAYTALCLARIEWTLARARRALLAGEKVSLQAHMRAALRAGGSAAEQAQAILLASTGAQVSGVEDMVLVLRDTGHADVLPHLVSAAARELADLRRCRARMEAVGWVREFMRERFNEVDKGLSAYSALAL